MPNAASHLLAQQIAARDLDRGHHCSFLFDSVRSFQRPGRAEGRRTRSRTRSDNRVVLCLLGPPELRGQGGVRMLELRPKGLALLAYLALVEEPQPRSRLSDLLEQALLAFAVPRVVC